jgi:GNAT superfamily N-acetyltransferase
MIRMVTLQLYERRLGAPAAPGALPAGVELAVWDSPIAADVALGRWHPEAEQRLRDGQVCAVARHGNDIVASCWLTCTPVRVTEIRRLVVPGPEDVYLYDAFTIPAWRGSGLFSALLQHLLAFARTRGRARALIFALARNRASRRAIERAGFEVFGRVSRVEICGLERLWYRGPRSRAARTILVTEGRRRPE